MVAVLTETAKTAETATAALLSCIFVGQAKGGQGALQSRQNRQNRQDRHEGYSLELNPPFPSSWDMKRLIRNAFSERPNHASLQSKTINLSEWSKLRDAPSLLGCAYMSLPAYSRSHRIQESRGKNKNTNQHRRSQQLRLLAVLSSSLPENTPLNVSRETLVHPSPEAHEMEFRFLPLRWARGDKFR